jgi:hypothetical protein
MFTFLRAFGAVSVLLRQNRYEATRLTLRLFIVADDFHRE